MEKKIAVLFPGIGYTADRPLLYYSSRIAASYGYEIKKLPYGNMIHAGRLMHDREAQKQVFLSAYQAIEDMLGDTDFSRYASILFISKSIGTALACAYGKEHHLMTKNIYYTPLEDTFAWMKENSGTAFSGTADPWVNPPAIVQACKDRQIPLYTVENGNHSLETGSVREDIHILGDVMRETEKYIQTSE